MVNEVLLGLTNTDLWEGSLINMKEGSCSSIRHAVQKSCAAICNDLLVFHMLGLTVYVHEGDCPEKEDYQKEQSLLQHCLVVSG